MAVLEGLKEDFYIDVYSIILLQVEYMAVPLNAYFSELMTPGYLMQRKSTPNFLL